MIVSIKKSELKRSIAAEPSKSMAHRLLIAAGLSDGESRIDNIAGSEDILATADCLRALGAELRIEEAHTGAGCGGAASPEADASRSNAMGTDAGAAARAAAVNIKGTDPALSEAAALNCRESGSTLRFFMPIAALSGRRMRFEGSDRLMERPLSVYEEIFRDMGIAIRRGDGFVETEGILRPGEFGIDAGISSQFISGLLFALPLLDKGSVLHLKPPVESSAYIDMTIDALDSFGVRIERRAAGQDNASPGDTLNESRAGETIIIPGGQSYKANKVSVEGDWSNAAFFIAMGVDVTGLNPGSLQGDKVCREYFKRLGRGYDEIDISDCPDLGPVLMAYAAMHEGCTLTGTRRLRLKESDRGSAMREELSKFGIETGIGDNSIRVGAGLRTPEDILSGHNDHRIVMSLAMLCSITGGVIEGAEAVNKSFPAFFERFREAGGICECSP